MIESEMSLNGGKSRNDVFLLTFESKRQRGCKSLISLIKIQVINNKVSLVDDIVLYADRTHTTKFYVLHDSMQHVVKVKGNAQERLSMLL